MLCLPDRDLPPITAGELRAHQQTVDAEATYADRVAKGKQLFQKHNKKDDRTFSVIRATLSEMASNVLRCCYCELSEIDQVEHVAPKDLFPDLCFSWNNYLYACGPCNRSKSNSWWIIAGDNVVVDVTRKRGAPIVSPMAGQPLMLNPRVDDPLEYLFLDTLDTFELLAVEDTGLAKLRAEKTIELLNLNREAVRVARETAFSTYREILRSYVHEISGDPTQAVLDRIRLGLLRQPHPCVWEFMKRQRAAHADLVALFQAAPEALTWSIGN